MNEVREYGNGTNENTGITKYKAGEGWIEVQFRDGSVYRYTDESAGESNIRTMHVLADAGRQLNSFINTNVRTRYEAKVW